VHGFLKSKLGLLLLAALVLAACVSAVVLALSAAHSPPEGGRDLLTAGRRVSVELFEVRDAAGEVLWRIEAVEPKLLSSVHYGEVPVGYRQTVPAEGRPPRPFVEGEGLETYTVTDRSIFSHQGQALDVRRFMGGVYQSGPRGALER
jgi:hypothetical protein